MGILANENAISAGGYQISNSLRFQSASSQYLSRTTSSTPTDFAKWTFSAWIKRGTLGTDQVVIGGYVDANNRGAVLFSGDNLQVTRTISGSATALRITNAVFRDPSAWYHVVVIFDSNNSTVANRVRMFVNGTEQAYSTSNDPGSGSGLYVNRGSTLNTLGQNGGGLAYFDGYLAEVNFIDGQALTPSSFGETNTLTGQWVAKKYTGTYGTNGFYLPFSNGTSTTTLGADSSGNGNNWTLTNFTRSAGTSDCWMLDVPSGNGGVSATQPSSNYCVLNPLDNNSMTLSGANLNAAGSTTYGAVRSSFALSSGKWYYEVSVLQNVSGNLVGIAPMASVFNTTNIYPNALAIDNTTIGGIKTVGVTIDFTALECKFYVNNVLASTQTIVNSNAPYSPFVADGSSGNNASYSINFGQRSFAYTPPSGFVALCTANLPASTIKQGNKYMDATTYSGNLVGQSITNAGSFKPDLVWVKSRSAATDNKLTDSNRGAQKALVSNSTAAETTDLTGVVSFDTGGFTLGTSTTYNNTGATYVGWQWQAGQGSTSSNTNGSITSTVSVSTTAGFSIVTWTNPGTAQNYTIGHGLGVAPKMIIVKDRSAANVWIVWQTSYSASSGQYLVLNSTAALATSANIWGAVNPTSTTFGLASNVNPNLGSSMVAYCFAEIAGFSKFGSYTGNGSADGVFVYTGFRPKFVLLKITSTTGDWYLFDTSRSPYNVAGERLCPDLSAAEATGSAYYLDMLSNGFKLRNTSTELNGSGATFIYACFAENPLANSNAR